MSVANGPLLSAAITRIQAADPEARGSPTLELMPESASAGLRADAAGAHARQLGVIVRDATAVADGRALLCAALDEDDAGGRPFVERLLEGYDGDPPARAAAMAQDYLAQLLPPLLRLWTAHGIALEPHMQNTLVRIERGRPAGFVVRDLGGIRVHVGRSTLSGELAPGSFIVTDDESEALDKLVHALLHAHVSTVLRALDRRYRLDPARGWALCAAQIERCLTDWARDGRLAARCAFDRARLFAPRVRAKALFRMRIAAQCSQYSYTERDNPLAR